MKSVIQERLKELNMSHSEFTRRRKVTQQTFIGYRTTEMKGTLNMSTVKKICKIIKLTEREFYDRWLKLRNM